MSRNRFRGNTRWSNVRLTYLRNEEIDALLKFAKLRDALPTQIILDALREAGVENLQETVEVRKYRSRYYSILDKVRGRKSNRRSLSLSISLPAHARLNFLTASWRQDNGGDYRCSIQAFMRRALVRHGVRGIGPVIRPSPAEIECGINCNGLCGLTHVPCASFDG